MIHPSCQIPNLEAIYKQHFGDRKDVSFVEVGAFDGMTYSNTWGTGWTGLYIEANPDFAKQCAINNPHCKVVAAACGDHNGTIDLTVFGEVSTAKLSRWNRDWGMTDETPKVTVPLRTLESILEEEGIGHFDLLVIDVEEMEIEVLKGFDLQKHLPKMVIIELHETQGTAPDQKGYQEPWVTAYLKGYTKIYADAINSIYIR